MALQRAPLGPRLLVWLTALAAGVVACNVDFPLRRPSPGTEESGADAGVPDAGGPLRDAGPLPDASVVCARVSPEWGRGQDLMLPGDDCRRCHTPRGLAKETLSVAGTVFTHPACPDGVPRAVIHVTDATGRRVDLTTNEAGNFFLHDALTMPLQVSLEANGEVVTMRAPVTNGSCNVCHQGGSSLGWLAAPRSP